MITSIPLWMTKSTSLSSLLGKSQMFHTNYLATMDPLGVADWILSYSWRERDITVIIYLTVGSWILRIELLSRKNKTKTWRPGQKKCRPPTAQRYPAGLNRRYKLYSGGPHHGRKGFSVFLLSLFLRLIFYWYDRSDHDRNAAGCQEAFCVLINVTQTDLVIIPRFRISWCLIFLPENKRKIRTTTYISH